MKHCQRWYRRRQLLSRKPPEPVAFWLFTVDSLTAEMVRRYGGGFNVRLLSQHYGRMRADESRVMGVPSGAALVREVLLRDGDRPLVYARTVIPVSTLRGPRRRYANLGNRPLGGMLFADRSMRRGEVEVCDALPEASRRWLGVDGATRIWGRRSVFRVGGKPLLVSEYFLFSTDER